MEEKTEILIKEVSAILLRDWDPLEVADFPEARTEYEGYAAEIIRMYEKNTLSAESLYAYLGDITENALNMKSEKEPMARAVTNIMTILKQ